MENKNITLYEWAYKDGVNCSENDENLKDTFISMDKALRYLHDKNCVVESFNPYDIELINGNTNGIYYTKFSPIQNPFNRDELCKDNLFKSSCLQIGMFTNTLADMNIEFLKSNFDSFAENIPADLVPYYRGIITRGANVYLCDFLAEKSKRDLINLQKELAGEDEEIELTDTNVDLTNKEVNDTIYGHALSMKKKGSYNDYGMVNVMLLVTIILIVLIFISVITLVFI